MSAQNLSLRTGFVNLYGVHWHQFYGRRVLLDCPIFAHVYFMILLVIIALFPWKYCLHSLHGCRMFTGNK